MRGKRVMPCPYINNGFENNKFTREIQITTCFDPYRRITKRTTYKRVLRNGKYCFLEYVVGNCSGSWFRVTDPEMTEVLAEEYRVQNYLPKS